MRKWIAGLLFITAFATTADGWAANRAGMVSVEVDLSERERGEEARLWLPYPVSDTDQTITDVRVSGDYDSAAVYTDSTNGTPMLSARWQKEAASRKLTLSFVAQRREVIRRDFPNKETSWDPADYRQYLAPTRLGPVEREVKKLADAITKEKTTVFDKARAIYDWTCTNMYRDPNTKGCGTGDVCALLQKPGGKCADISSVFVALCRAAGVPAREIFGIRLGRKAEEEITAWQHCWAEFYLPGYGWVPVDPADVRKAILTDNLKIEDARAKEYREFFWGRIDPYRVRLSVGRDLVLNPPQAGAPLNYFMYPYAEVGGKAVDWLEPKSFVYRITFREK